MQASNISGGGAGGPRLLSFASPGPMPGNGERVKSHNQPYKYDGGQFSGSNYYEEIQGISGGASDPPQD